MDRLQRAGGIAALFEALAYLTGFAVMAAADPGNTESWSAAQKLGFVLEHQALQLFWSLFGYAFSIALIVLTVALNERLKNSASALMKIATPFGFIWASFVIASGMIGQIGLAAVAQLHAEDVAQAVSSWTVISAVQDGLGGGVELLGGVWVLLLSAALLRADSGSRALAGFGVMVGLAGVLTVVPQLAVMKAVFGLSQIGWFAWVGIWLLRRQ